MLERMDTQKGTGGVVDTGFHRMGVKKLFVWVDESWTAVIIALVNVDARVEKTSGETNALGQQSILQTFQNVPFVDDESTLDRTLLLIVPAIVRWQKALVESRPSPFDSKVHESSRLEANAGLWSQDGTKRVIGVVVAGVPNKIS